MINIPTAGKQKRAERLIIAKHVWISIHEYNKPNEHGLQNNFFCHMCVHVFWDVLVFYEKMEFACDKLSSFSWNSFHFHRFSKRSDTHDWLRQVRTTFVANAHHQRYRVLGPNIGSSYRQECILSFRVECIKFCVLPQRFSSESFYTDTQKDMTISIALTANAGGKNARSGQR